MKVNFLFVCVALVSLAACSGGGGGGGSSSGGGSGSGGGGSSGGGGGTTTSEVFSISLDNVDITRTTNSASLTIDTSAVNNVDLIYNQNN